MVPPVEFRLHIDAYSRDTIPMERLAKYMLDWAYLLGETQSVHFSHVDGGSTVPVAKVAWEAAPKVRKRIAEVRGNEGPQEAKDARRRIDRMLVDDNASATILELPQNRKGKAAKLLYFPGARAAAEAEYGPFKQPATLTGVPIVIGGEADPVPVHLQDRDAIYICRANRDTAKELAPFLFTTPVRVAGVGIWFRSRDGEWEMKKFTIQTYDVLDHETVAEAAARVQRMRTALNAMQDPIAELLALQAEEKKGRKR